MSDTIGSTAGVVWEFLEKEGTTSVTKLAKETKLDTKLAQRALGWLAREDKVEFSMKGRTEVVGLK